MKVVLVLGMGWSSVGIVTSKMPMAIISIVHYRSSPSGAGNNLLGPTLLIDKNQENDQKSTPDHTTHNTSNHSRGIAGRVTLMVP